MWSVVNYRNHYDGEQVRIYLFYGLRKNNVAENRVEDPFFLWNKEYVVENTDVA